MLALRPVVRSQGASKKSHPIVFKLSIDVGLHGSWFLARFGQEELVPSSLAGRHWVAEWESHHEI